MSSIIDCTVLETVTMIKSSMVKLMKHVTHMKHM